MEAARKARNSMIKTDFTIICNPLDEDVATDFIHNILDMYSNLTFSIRKEDYINKGEYYMMQGDRILTRKEMGLDEKE